MIEYMIIGFLTAFGWWGATKFVIEPHLDPLVPAVEKKKDEKVGLCQ